MLSAFPDAGNRVPSVCVGARQCYNQWLCARSRLGRSTYRCHSASNRNLFRRCHQCVWLLRAVANTWSLFAFDYVCGVQAIVDYQRRCCQRNASG